MCYLLDTNACIRVLNRTSESVIERLKKHRPSEIAIASVVRAELYFGARKSTRVERNLAVLKRFFAPLGSAPFNDACAEHYGMLRADLERAGTPIGPNDMLIAATARAYDAVLVTGNTEEFQRIVGLRLEDWERA